MKPRTTLVDGWERRAWRKSGWSKEGRRPMHAPDTELDPACPRRLTPTDWNWMGHLILLCHKFLTGDKDATAVTCCC
jgi:hypothetical protein